MRPYIVANWKMHGLLADLQEIAAIDQAAQRCDHVDVALALPATLLFSAADAVHMARIGGQDCHQKEQGAHTGCISAAMLVEAGASFSIVGHSERRADQAETSTQIAEKAQTLQSRGMGAILCIGEDLPTRESGGAEDFVCAQLDRSLTFDNGRIRSDNLTIAYEPIWAIGTGHVPEIAQITAMHDRLRAELVTLLGERGHTIRILYGGSVKASNAQSILALDNVNGALVGGAGLKAETFIPIIEAA